jgi:hypothetical protein
MKNLAFPTWLVLILFCPLIGYSQKTFLSIGGELAIPQTERLTMVAGPGYGGSLRLERSWGRHFSGMVTGGYLWFKPKDSDYLSATSTFRALPIQAGVKYFPFDKAVVGLFFSTELGMMVTKRETVYHAFDPDFARTYYDLSVAPGIGYRLGKVEPSFRLQFNLSDAGFNVYYLNFRIAYTLWKSKRQASLE